MPFSEKQQQFFREASHRWNFKTGATRSGKTYMDFFLIPKRIRARAGKDGLCVIMGVSKATIERNILEPMRNLWPAGLVGRIGSNNTCQLFGETVHCLGAEKVSQVSKLRGTSVKYCYGDEVADWSPEVFELLKSRLDKPYSCFDGSLNPQGPNHWLKAFLESSADIYDQKYTIFDNPFLPPGFVENLCKEYEGTVYYKRYILGEWALAEGMVYRDFADHPEKYQISDVKKWLEENKERFGTISYGVDFGGTGSATKFQCTGITLKGTVIALDEEYIDHKKESVDPNDLNRRFAKFIDRCTRAWGGGVTRADSAEQILIRGLFNTARACGLKTQVKNALKMPINDRIKLTLVLMAQRRFYVSKACPHLTEALATAVYDDKKPVDTRLDDGTSDIDSLDAFEYSIEPFYRQLEAMGHKGERI